MKVLISILLVLVSVSGFSQNSTTNVFCLAPSCKQSVQLPVSVDTLFARLTTGDGYKSVVWKQLSGPNTATLGTQVINLTSPSVGASIQPISNLVAGSYVFQATGTSTGGTTGTATVSLTVQPAIVVVPPTKTVRFTISLSNGQTFTYYSDGSGTIQ
jgi:hypothetical protein